MVARDRHAVREPTPGTDRRPRLLYVVRVIPYVPAPGGVTRAFHLMRAAASIADVTLVVASDDPATARRELLAPLCAEVRVIPAPLRLSTPVETIQLPRRARARIAAAVRWLALPDPYPRDTIDRAALRAMVRGLLAADDYDLVVVQQGELAAILRDVVHAWGGPALADLHDVDSALARQGQRLRRQHTGRRRPSLSEWRSVRQLRGIEREIPRTYARVTVTSQADARHVRSLAPGARIDVVPNGVDADYFAVVGAASAAQTLVFTGSLWYPPNVDALRYFLDDIWPLIIGRHPAARFWIVGHDPVPAVRAMAARVGVEVYPSVADVRPYLAGSAVAVVPLRLGSGTRLKILEALAASRPVVSTTPGAEGLELEPGRDLLLADTPHAFAAAVAALLERPPYARELAAHGCATVRRRYDWPVIATGFQAVLWDTVRHGSTRRRR